MACPQLLPSLANFVADAARNLAEVEVVVCGATDLCHPKLDDRFEENRGIQEPGQCLMSLRAEDAVFMVFLQHLLQNNYIHGVGRHTLDGMCSLQAFEQGGGLAVLNDVCFGILITWCFWLKHVFAKPTCVTKVCLFVVCTAGKHRSMYCARVLFIVLKILLKLCGAHAAVKFVWGAQNRCLAEKYGEHWRRQPLIVVDRFQQLWAEYVRKHKIQCALFRVTDHLYEKCKPKTATQHRMHRAARTLLTEPFQLAIFLRTIESNLRGTVVNLLPENVFMPLSMWLCTTDVYTQWQNLFGSYIQDLWPDLCSLCCDARKTAYSFRRSVEKKFESLMQNSSMPVRAVDASDVGRRDAQATSSAGYPAELKPARKKEAEPSKRVPIQSSGTSVRAAVAQGDAHERAKKKPRRELSDDVTAAWVATVDLDKRTVSEWQESKLDQLDMLLLMTDTHCGKHYGIASKGIEANMQETADALMKDESFLIEFNASTKLMFENDNIPWTCCPCENNLSKIEFVLFWHLMSIATLRSQDLQCGATAQFLALVGNKFWQDLHIDLLDLMHNYVWILWMCRNVTDSTWLDKCLMLFVPETTDAEQFWIVQQDHLGCVSRYSFAKEYVCIAACPWNDEKEIKDEVSAMKERMKKASINVEPEMPAPRLWYEHDAAVLAQDALPTPRPLPCVRASAPPAPCFWGNGDGIRGNVNRRNMIAETHVYLQPHETKLPESLSLDDVLGNNFLDHSVRGFHDCKIPVPVWLLAAAAEKEATASDSAVDAELSECADYLRKWVPQIIYQCLGAALMAVIRPDNVMHPHVRSHFELHMGFLVAKEIRLQRMTAKLYAFMRGCGVRFETCLEETDHWLQRMIRKRKANTKVVPTISLHSMWGEKLRPQCYSERTKATELHAIYLVGLACQDAYQTKHPCKLHREFAGCGTICNQYHALSKRHSLLLFFHVLQYLRCESIGSRGKDYQERDDGFVYTLSRELNLEPPATKSYHANPLCRLQLFGLPRFLPLYCSDVQVQAQGEETFTTFPGATVMRKNFRKEDIELLPQIVKKQVQLENLLRQTIHLRR